MNSTLLMNFSVDKENKTINIEREFAAPVKRVWAAWTESDLLDQWWAPKPWKTQTKIMDFRDGGYWLYAMVGPDGTTHWSRADYESITPIQRFTSFDAFCDEDGAVNDALPGSHWTNQFNETSGSTRVTIQIKYKDVADLEKYLEMGFKDGFMAAFENLDEILKA